MKIVLWSCKNEVESSNQVFGIFAQPYVVTNASPHIVLVTLSDGNDMPWTAGNSYKVGHSHHDEQELWELPQYQLWSIILSSNKNQRSSYTALPWHWDLEGRGLGGDALLVLEYPHANSLLGAMNSVGDSSSTTLRSGPSIKSTRASLLKTLPILVEYPNKRNSRCVSTWSEAPATKTQQRFFSCFRNSKRTECRLFVFKVSIITQYQHYGWFSITSQSFPTSLWVNNLCTVGSVEITSPSFAFCLESFHSFPTRTPC